MKKDAKSSAKKAPAAKKSASKKPVAAKAAPAKSSAAAKKPAVAKKKQSVKKAAPVKKVAPAKKAAPTKKAAPVKKAAPAKKSPAVKKPQPAAKKPVAVKAVAETAKASSRRPPIITKPVTPEYRPVDTASAIAFAMSIAEEMKRSAQQKENDIRQNEIKLSRRPTSRTQKGTSEKFPVTDLKEFKKRLLLERDKAVKGVDAMRATGFNESEDHEADGGDGTNQTLRLQALGQMGNINRTIQQIEEALHRIDDGTYGVCTVCGQLIRKPRLLNQPFVLTCMECQSEMERGVK